MSATRIHPAYDEYRRARDEMWERDRYEFRAALELPRLEGVDLDRDYLAEAREQIEHISWASVGWISQTRNIGITVSVTIEGAAYSAESIESPATFVYAMISCAGAPYMHRVVRSLCDEAMGEFARKDLGL